MSDLLGNHIVGFSTRWPISSGLPASNNETSATVLFIVERSIAE